MYKGICNIYTEIFMIFHTILREKQLLVYKFNLRYSKRLILEKQMTHYDKEGQIENFIQELMNRVKFLAQLLI